MNEKSYRDIPNAEREDIGRVALIEEGCNPLCIEDNIETCLATCTACGMMALDGASYERPMTMADCEEIAYLVTE